MAAPADRVYLRSPEAIVKPVGAGFAVYLRDRKAIHVLNPTGRLLFELLQEPASTSELVEALVVATGAERRMIADDVCKALEEFRAEGLISEVAT